MQWKEGLLPGQRTGFACMLDKPKHHLRSSSFGCGARKEALLMLLQRAKRAAPEKEEAEPEAEEEDTTGMTALQAWAAKQRVARRAAARKSAAPTRRPRKVGGLLDVILHPI